MYHEFSILNYKRLINKKKNGHSKSQVLVLQYSVRLTFKVWSYNIYWNHIRFFCAQKGIKAYESDYRVCFLFYFTLKKENQNEKVLSVFYWKRFSFFFFVKDLIYSYLESLLKKLCIWRCSNRNQLPCLMSFLILN